MIRSVTKSELFSRACELNVLRREAHLPLRDVQQVIAAEEDRLAWNEYGRAVERYQAVYEELRERVRQEYLDAGKADLMSSAGGRWLLDRKAMKLLEEFLEAKGHFRPKLRSIPYGGERVN